MISFHPIILFRMSNGLSSHVPVDSFDVGTVRNFLQRGVVGDFYAHAGAEVRGAVGLLKDVDLMNSHASELLAAAVRIGDAAMQTLKFVPAVVAREFLQCSDMDLQYFFQGLSTIHISNLHFDPRLISDPKFHVHMQGYLAHVLRNFFEVQGRMTEEWLADTPRSLEPPELPSNNWVSYRFVDRTPDVGGTDESDLNAVEEARAKFFHTSGDEHKAFLQEMLRFDPDGFFEKPDWVLPEHLVVSGDVLSEKDAKPFLSAKAHFAFPPDKDNPHFRKRFHVSGFRRVDFDKDRE